MATAIKALATLTLSASQTSVTFSSIPTSGPYRDLRLVMTGTTVTGTDLVYFNMNSLTGTNIYSRVIMSGNGTSATSAGDVDSTGARLTLVPSWTSTEPAMLTADIIDYMATDKHKQLLVRSSRAGAGTEAMVVRVASLAAISSIVLTLYSGGSFAIGSTFTLYGVTA